MRTPDMPVSQTAAAPARVFKPEPGPIGQDAMQEDDLARAVALFTDLRRQGVVLAFQAIVDASGFPGESLYHEGLARAIIPDAPGGMASLGEAIQTLERLGQIRAFDRCVVTATIQTLRDHPAQRLGCNMSSQSVVIDGFWTQLIQQLRREPDVARRLVIEFTETTRIEDPIAALQFMRTMQELGCKIAFDDFGTGAIPPDFVIHAKPDIIKIDKGYLVRARDNSQSRTILRRLIEFCAAITDTIVLEGVETREDQALAEQAGAQWMQGFWFARPNVLPPGLHTPCVVIAPLSSTPAMD
ncbi:EAL domain-containing protein [Achromobacter pestifer]|uniref:EAL domain-containing protein n=1 Tax=Achromobacter pestifer TaxID=1353889 RepID=A0A6S6YZ44_9BURK|nr:EAL domain-containing protein [Achromobacter pestifer]CAB3653841.1 hypothetical protein LMG3431_02994 [Achromobacter pestifer]